MNLLDTDLAKNNAHNNADQVIQERGLDLDYLERLEME
jgi:hypothetical protein